MTDWMMSMDFAGAATLRALADVRDDNLIDATTSLCEARDNIDAAEQEGLSWPHATRAREWVNGLLAGLWAEEKRLRAKVPTGGASLIATERARQVDAEGWTAEHDDAHSAGEMASAAATYALQPRRRGHRYDCGQPMMWPWPDWYKPSPDNRVRELVKAGALIAAEIDRLQRLEAANV